MSDYYCWVSSSGASRPGNQFFFDSRVPDHYSPVKLARFPVSLLVVIADFVVGQSAQSIKISKGASFLLSKDDWRR